MHSNPRLTLHALSRSIVIRIVPALTLAVSATAAMFTVTSTADSGGACSGPNSTLRQAIAKNCFSASRLILILCWTIWLAMPLNAQAATRTVTSLGDTDDPNDGVLTLREAIATAAVGDTIDFAVTGTISLALGELGIARSLNIVNNGAGTVAIETQKRSRIFNVTGGTVTISNLTLTSAAVHGTDKLPNETGDGGDGEGGAVFVGPAGTLTLTHCVLQGNSATGGKAGKSNGVGAFGGAGNGGAIANRGNLTLRGCYITGNTATGGLFNDSSGGLGNGGGVFNGGFGFILMSGCTVYDNRAIGSKGSGGGTAGGGRGGGFANGDERKDSDRGVFAISNCTFMNNVVSGGSTDTGSAGKGRGGGIDAYRNDLGSGTLMGSVTNCTLANNAADGGTGPNSVVAAQGVGGGLAVERGTLQVDNTIIARNSTLTIDSVQTPDVEGGGIVSQGYNFIGVGDGTPSTTWKSSDNVGTASTPLDAQFGQLTTYDLTPVLRLKFSSAAIDAGNSPLTTDQRGGPRPVDQAAVANAAGGNGSDIGAYEMRGPTTFVVTNTADSGAGSLRQAIADANDEGQFDTITFNIPTSDPGYDASTQVYSINLTSGELSVTSPMSINGGNARIAVGRAGSAPFRLFTVTASGVTLANLSLRNGAFVGTPNAPGLGGGVFNSGGLTLLNCAFSGNTAMGGAGAPQVSQGVPGGNGLGGAVYNNGALVMTNCTLTANSVQGGTGGPGLSAPGVVGRGGNAGNGEGGGLFSEQGTVTLTNCTITQNTALPGAPGSGPGGDGNPGVAVGGGALFASGNAALRNSIISGNTGGGAPDYAGTVSGNANLIGGTPQLDGALKYNGGATPTIALLAGSPAINAGDDTVAPGTDQRGFPRVGVSDIGAFEFGSSAPTPTPTPTPGSLGNVSTRLQVGTGNNVLFAGFIIQGNASKTVLIRSAGPSLTQFGVPGALGDPQLELHDANNTIGTNDNWQTTQIGGVITSDQTAAIQNSGAPPANPAEPAIIATLPAGGYTAIVQGVGATQGVATVEVYDLSADNGAVLANISTRGFIQTGANVMIGGFIVVGQSSNVLIRATGPSLVPFGINNALANPRLELHDANGTLAANDDWQTTQIGGIVTTDQSAAIQGSGLAPSNAAESAIIATLAPGNYTAIAQGVNGGTGVGLIEVFALP